MLAMDSLNISKVAVGCASFEALKRRQESRLADGVVPIMTRFRPKRAAELIGGSIYWIIKHRVAARQRILGFAESEEPGGDDDGLRGEKGPGSPGSGPENG